MVLTLRLCVLYLSGDNLQLWPNTSSNDWFFKLTWRLFTARYALSLYIRMRFVFKALKSIKYVLQCLLQQSANSLECCKTSNELQETKNALTPLVVNFVFTTVVYCASTASCTAQRVQQFLVWNTSTSYAWHFLCVILIYITQNGIFQQK
jgi:hypothetical protein